MLFGVYIPLLFLMSGERVSAGQGDFFSERSSRSLLARKNRNCVPLPAEFGVVHPDFVVPEQGNSSNIYSILDLKISLGYNSYNAKYQDLYSSPANIVWLREC
jgi:hypothetical protein